MQHTAPGKALTSCLASRQNCSLSYFVCQETGSLFQSFQKGTDTRALHLSAPLAFAAYETKVLDITQLLTSLGVDPAQAPEGGITIVPAGANPALIASGRISDPATGFSSTVDFPSAELEHASALHATGVPIGTPSSDSPFAAAGTFVPHVVVRNLLASPQTVTVTLEYPQVATGNGSTPLDPVAAQDGTHSPPTVQSPLAPVTVAAYSTQDISLAPAMNQFPAPLPFCSVRIQYSGPAGSLQAQVSSIESKGNLVVDSHIQNEGNGWAGSGANPWHLDPDTESILFLTNESGQPARIGAQVAANGVTYYLTKLQLNPHETRVIDLRKLRDAQVPDFKKNLIPASATDGSVSWNRIDNVAVMGRLMVINRQQGMASNYDCLSCSCPLSYMPYLDCVSPASCNLGVGGTLGLILYAGYESCNALDYFFDVNGSDSWTSQYPNIASVNSSSGTVTGQSGGTTSVTGQYSDYIYVWNPVTYSCNASPGSGGGSGPCDVVPEITSISPTYAMVGSSNVQITINGTGFATNATVNLPSGFTASSGCTPGNSVSSTKIVTCVNISVNRAIQAVSFSVTNNPGNSNSVAFTADGPVTLAVVSDNWSSNTRQITYSVATLAGQEIPGISIGEVVTTSGCNCTGGCPGLSFDLCGGTLTTSLQSDIPDSWTFPSGSSPVGCGLNIVDHWQWCGTGAPTAGWTIGSPSGYIHTNASSISGYVMPGNPMPAGLVIAP